MALIVASIPAAGQKFFASQYQTKQGLPSDKVRMVAQDARGFIWVATDGGLARFNGKSFRLFKTQLESKYIKAFCSSKDSSLILANDTGIYKIKSEQDQISIELFVPGNVQASDTSVLYPNRLLEDSKGRLWISQPNGSIAVWQNGSIQFFPFGKSHTTGYSNSRFSMVEGPLGTIWIAATTGQIYRLDEKENKFRPYLKLSPKPLRIHDMLVDGKALWIAGDGLWKVELTTQSAQYFDTQDMEIASIGIHPQKNNLYLGTTNQGLFRAQIQGRNLALQKVFGSNDSHRINSLPFFNINHIFVDKDENIWLSSLQGLGLLQSRFFESIFGLANNNTYVIAPGDAHQILLSFGDVFEISQDNHEFFGQVLPGVDKGFVTAISAQGQGYWMGTASGELFYYYKNQILRTIDLSNRGGGIFYIKTDRQNQNWICQAPDESPITGLAKLDSDHKLHLYEREKGLDSRILVLEESPRGILYAAGIGPETYLYRYQDQTDAFINISLPLTFNYSQNFEVHDLTVDHQGLVWLGTTDGLLCYDLERIKRVDLGDFTSSEIRSVCALDNGSIWLATDTKGLIHYRDGAMVHFNEESGLPTTITSYRSMVVDHADRIWIGTAEGTVYSHDTMPVPQKTVTPLLLSFSIDGRLQNLPLASTSLANNASIEAQFVSLSYPGQAILYQSRLRGSPDSAWSQALVHDKLNYSNLKFGDYQLEIRAKQSGGFAWSSPLVLPFRVRQIWYKTWWGISLLSISALLSLFYLFQFNIGRLLNRIQFLEKTLVAQQKEIKIKESLLQQKTAAIKDQLSHQQDTIQHTYSNLNFLHQLITQIPRNSSWTSVITSLKNAIEQPIGIDAFEFGFFHDQEIQFLGYSRRNQSFIQRTNPYDENNNLGAWALNNRTSILIDDFRLDHQRYIKKQRDYQYQSQIIIPFEIAKKQQLIMAVYGLKKQAFDQHDLLTLKILTDYISIAVSDKLDHSSGSLI